MARIRVKLQDGRTGTIEDTQFNPQMMTRLDEQVAPQTATATKPEENLIQKTNVLPILGAILGGGAGFFGAGPIGAAAGGAAGAGGGELLEQMLFNPRNAQGQTEFNVGGLAAETAMGGVAGPVGKVAANIAKPVVRPIVGALGKVLQPIGKQAATQVLRTTGAVFEKAAAKGYDVRSIFREFPFKGNYEQMLGQADEFLKPAEQRIQKAITTLGTKKMISTKSAFDALENEYTILSGQLDQTKTKALRKVIDEAKKKFGDSITPKQALEFKRTIDSKFGQTVSVVLTGREAVLADAQKTIANAFRKELKVGFPDIAKDLDIESKLLTLRPILSKAQGLASTEELFPTGLSGIVGAGFIGGAGILGGLPGAAGAFAGFSAARAALRNPRIFSSLTRATAPQAAKEGIKEGYRGATALGQVLLRGIGAKLPTFTSTKEINDNYQQSTIPVTSKTADEISIGRQQTSDILNQTVKTQQGLDPRRVALAMLAYPKYADLIEKVYKMTSVGGTNLQLSDGAVKNVTDVTGALSDVESLYGSISGSDIVGPITGLQAMSPYASKARTLQAEIDRVRQVVGKALEGGVLRKEDEEKYKKILPTITDTKEVALNKLISLQAKLNQDLARYIELQRAYGKGSEQETSGQEIYNLLQQSGY